MRLVVPFPSEWTRTREDGCTSVVVPGHASEPDLVIHVTELRGLPPIMDARFFAKQLAFATPAGSELAIVGTRDDVSAKGWPITIVRATVSKHGVVVEQRIAAVYRILDQLAAVIVTGTNPRRWNERVNDLGSLVLAADVHWAGPPASLAEILGFDADHPIFQR